MGEALCTVESLKKYYPVKNGFRKKNWGSVRAVDGVSFEIDRGEILGLVGESGSGKTTVGKTMLNLAPPTGGRLTFDGKLLFDIGAKRDIQRGEMDVVRRNMQMIFQDPYASLDPKMTIEKTITEGMVKYKTCPKNQLHEEAARLIEMCGLDGGSLRKYPNQFSGGQRQRVGIARALSLKPRLIICDEPTAALDVSIQSQILNLMLELKEKLGMSYLFISHNLSVVEHFCDRVCVMYLGTIVESAATAELFSSALHPYTRALLFSAPSINRRNKENRTLLSGEIPSPVNPPPGCKFHTRCPYAAERCRTEVPLQREVAPRHYVACHQA